MKSSSLRPFCLLAKLCSSLSVITSYLFPQHTRQGSGPVPGPVTNASQSLVTIAFITLLPFDIQATNSPGTFTKTVLHCPVFCQSRNLRSAGKIHPPPDLIPSNLEPSISELFLPFVPAPPCTSWLLSTAQLYIFLSSNCSFCLFYSVTY